MMWMDEPDHQTSRRQQDEISDLRMDFYAHAARVRYHREVSVFFYQPALMPWPASVNYGLEVWAAP